MQCRTIAVALLAASVGYSQELPEGTKVRVRLEQMLSSATAEEGQPVQLAVTEDVKAGDTVIIAQGATVNGTVVEAVPKRRMGRSGKLDFSIDKVMAVDGNSVPVRYSMVKRQGDSHTVRTGVITAGVAVVFWPAAPFMLLAKGKDTTINKGMVFEVFTDGKFVVKPKGETVAPGGRNGASAQITVTSEPTGADIEVDGKYVGSTPSTLGLSAGDHDIKVSRGPRIWRRTMQVGADSKVSVNAVLQ